MNVAPQLAVDHHVEHTIHKNVQSNENDVDVESAKKGFTKCKKHGLWTTRPTYACLCVPSMETRECPVCEEEALQAIQALKAQQKTHSSPPPPAPDSSPPTISQNQSTPSLLPSPPASSSSVSTNAPVPAISVPSTSSLEEVTNKVYKDGLFTGITKGGLPHKGTLIYLANDEKKRTNYTGDFINGIIY